MHLTGQIFALNSDVVNTFSSNKFDETGLDHTDSES